MSYSCLNMDDLNDQFNLETVNLCLKTENTELETEDIPGFNLLNNFLLSFDLFRGSFFQGTLTGYYIPFIQGNLLNDELYDNTIGILPYAENMKNLFSFFQSYYNLAINDISVFSSLNTKTYIIAKELCYLIDILYFPNIKELLDAPEQGPKGVFRRSVTTHIGTTILLDSVQFIKPGMYFRGPEELDYGGDNPITDPALLPVVVSVDVNNTSIEISKPTDVGKGSLILFDFPEFCSYNSFDPPTSEYPNDSYSFIIRMKNTLRDLIAYLEREITFETIDTKTSVNTTINVFEFTDLNGVKVSAPAETLVSGVTYRFDQTDSSNIGRPLQFSTTQDGTHNGGVAYTDNVITVGTPGFSEVAYTEITVTEDTPGLLFYFSPNYPNMGNVLSIVTNFMTPELETVTLLESNNINVTYNFAYNNTDWVGFYKEGDEPGTVGAQLWLYVGGSQTPTTLGTGSLLFDQSSEQKATIPLPSGNYTIYFFQNDTYKSYGKTLTLTIQ